MGSEPTPSDSLRLRNSAHRLEECHNRKRQRVVIIYGKPAACKKTGCWLLLCFKAVSHVMDAAQMDTGIFFQIHLAANGLHMMADKLPDLAIVWLLPDFFINLVMCQHLVYVLK